ncbi:MAG: signal recognition particle-docking protein FtsY [Pseudomonadota bacterium]
MMTDPADRPRKGFFSKLFGKKPRDIEPEDLKIDKETEKEGSPPPEPDQLATDDQPFSQEPSLSQNDVDDLPSDKEEEDADTGSTAEDPIDPSPNDDALSQDGKDDALPISPAATNIDQEPDTVPTELPPQEPAPSATAALEEDASLPPPKKKGLFGRLTAGLARTSQKLSGGIGAIFTKRKLDDETLEELEDLLIMADLGLPATTRILSALSKEKYDQEITDEEVRMVLGREVAKTLEPLAQPLTITPAHRPHIILMTGVNGAGKTTTIGKLAKKFSDEGKSVLLAAGDTFRAAAIEQLQVWGERTGAKVVTRPQGADAAGLAYDAIVQAQEEKIDLILIDTAGRLQNRSELMDELAKIVRVIEKLVPDAPHDTLLVLDATVGQNAISQAQTFTEIAGVTGLVMTKLDGTARGGVLVALADQFHLPIHYIGVGEAVEDLQPFNANEFAQALTALDIPLR